MVWLKFGGIGVIDEHKFANLLLLEYLARRKGESTHIRDKPDKEKIPLKQGVMYVTHEQAVTRLMFRNAFGLRRDPPSDLELWPLYLAFQHQAASNSFSTSTYNFRI